VSELAWDIQIENEVGDIVFTPAHDIAGVGGEALLRQRVSMRCKIPRGTYLYDTDGDLGSDLHLVPRSPSPAQQEMARAAITEALEPMRDEIVIRDIEITVTEQNQLQVNVVFSPISTDADVPTIDTSSDDIDAISVTIPQE
jgi:hypothetical protein